MRESPHDTGPDCITSARSSLGRPRYVYGLTTPLLPRPSTPKCSPQHPIPKHPQPTFLPQCQRPSFTPIKNNTQNYSSAMILIISLLMLIYIYGAPCKARNFNVVYIWTYVWQRWKPSLSIWCTMFQHWINAENDPVARLCVNTLLATKVTLITDGI
jgi:hypothetical protein